MRGGGGGRAGGVPSLEDVKAAVEDMDHLYDQCAWKGHLAEESVQGAAPYAKKELTLAQAQGIAEKLATQPFKPPAAAVLGGDVFPTA